MSIDARKPYDPDNIFAKILRGEIPCNKVFEDEWALAFMALTSLFGLAGAPAQNAAIQRIAPNEMRGQVTALYLFMFTFFGAMGSWVIGAVSSYVVGDPELIWQALLIVAAVFMPIATFFMWRAIKPYGEEVARLEALGR